jgi:GLPGLI family protein
MKHILNTALILFFPLIFFAQEAKTVEVIYIKAYKNHKDTTDVEPKLMKNLEYQLLFNNNESRFEHISSMSNDGDLTNERYIGMGGGRGVYYKNLKEKEKLRQVEDADGEELYLISEDIKKYEWVLQKDTKNILGYDCFKAIGSYTEYDPRKDKYLNLNVVVWYAPLLSASFGPSGFDGLPGLVLESYQGSFYLIAQEIKFHNKHIEIKRPKKGNKVTYKEYIELSYQGWLKQRGKQK